MFDGRKVAFKALFGSHNYNLNTPESDRDYKYFVIPTFEDLYKGKFFSTSKVGDGEDYDVHDIRQLPNLWWKANINFLEVLFSEDFHFMGIDGILYNRLAEIWKMRDKIARMNLPYLFNACIGMHYNKMKLLEKGTAGTQHLVDKFGYDTKQAMHAVRVIDFLVAFYDTDFGDFKKAITYDGIYKNLMLGIKQGVFTLDEFRKRREMALARAKSVEQYYTSQKPDEQTREEVDRLIMELVKSEIKS